MDRFWLIGVLTAPRRMCPHGYEKWPSHVDLNRLRIRELETAVHMALIHEVRGKPEKAKDSTLLSSRFANLWIKDRNMEYLDLSLHKKS